MNNDIKPLPNGDFEVLPASTSAPALFDFDADLVRIERKRRSTTQGSVVVSYDGKELGHYGDDIRLIKEGIHRGEYHGHDDAYWMAVAQRQAIAQGLVCDDDENKCSECRCTYEDGGDGFNGMCPSCADAAEEQTFKINVAMNIRAYGVVKVKAATIDDAQAQMTHQFIAENFNPHGGGSDDYDMMNPEQVWLGEWEAEDGESGELEIDLQDPDEERKSLSAGGVRAINAILDSEDMDVSSDVGDALVDILQNEPEGMANRDLNMILSALRLAQRKIGEGYDFSQCEVATNGFEDLPLTPDEIDGLCERLNEG